MPKTNITKITLFVILALIGAVASGCGSLAQNGSAQSRDEADFEAPARVGTLRSPALKEASGIAASRRIGRLGA